MPTPPSDDATPPTSTTESTSTSEGASTEPSSTTDRAVRRIGLGAVALFVGVSLAVAFDAVLLGVALAGIGLVALAAALREGHSDLESLAGRRP